MTTNKQVKNKNYIWLAVIAVILACVIGVVAAINNFSKTISEELYKERSYHLSETMTVVSDKAEIVINNNWDILKSAEVILNDRNITDAASISDALDYIEKINSNNNNNNPFMLIDNQRNCFRNDVDGGKNKWVDSSLLLNDDEKQIAMEEETTGASSSGTYLAFLLKLETPIEYEGGKLTHIAVAQSMENFRDVFLSSAYSNKNETILTRIDGTRFYYDDTYNSFSSYNVLNVIKKADFLYDVSSEQLINDFTNGKQGTAEISLNNENYFIGYTSLNEDWRYIIIVPEKFVSINTASFSDALLKGFVMFGSFIVILFGVVIAVVVYAINRNQKIALEQELNAQLIFANNQAREAEAAAQEASKAKSEFLSNMSHDIRTPINGIIGMLDIADLHKDETDKLPEYLDRIRAVTNHLLTLINDVLDMSKAESGKVELTNESFNLKTLVQECSDITKGRMLQRQLEYSEEFEDITENYLFGSPLHIKRILLNVLGNAVKYTNDGGHINLTVKEIPIDDNKTMVEFVVKDDGIGMSKEFQEHIFESFTRADNTVHSEARGTGLGMAISKKLVDLMNGEILLESELNKGSTFTIKLPLTIDKAETHNEVQINETNSDDISGMNILLVEDNDLNREIAKTLLEDKEVKITEAINGQEGVDIFKASKENEFDIILMDVMMPIKNGLEASEEIRSLDRKDAKSIPIIAMTANAFAEDVKKTRDAGMNEHLSKPLNIQQLIHTIAKYKNTQGGNV